MIHWLVQTQRDCPTDLHWLSAGERVRLEALRHPKRRREWLLGRWTAKQALQHAIEQTYHTRPALNTLIIENAPSGAPVAHWVGGQRLAGWEISLSHSHDRALCALTQGAAIGADIEWIEPRDEAFVRDYFTPTEVSLVERAPARAERVTAIWSAKEAALKALHLGLTVDTRAVECLINHQSAPHSDWKAFDIHSDPRRLHGWSRPLAGWWQVSENFVLTLALHHPHMP